MALAGEGRVVLDPGESLFLSGGHDSAVDHQRGGAVMIKRGDAQDRGHVPSRSNRRLSQAAPRMPGL